MQGQTVMGHTEVAKRYSRRQKIANVLLVVILGCGFLQLLFGERLIGIAILASSLAILMPSFVTRGRVRSLPLEFELLLFAMVVLQFVIGETLNFYENVRHYDKLVHFSLPLFLGFISAMLVYTMVTVGSLKMSVSTSFVVVVLLTLGIGAFWEIIEYLSDVFLGTYLQGSLTSVPLVDTMNDLIVDTFGGIFGAIIAIRYVRRQRSDPNSRLSELTSEIAAGFGGAKSSVVKVAKTGMKPVRKRAHTKLP